MRKSALLAAPLALAALSGAALAGPATHMAQAHFAAIAKGDVAAITAMTAPNATLRWVGGPLDGVYESAEAQKSVWTKFATAQDEQKATVSDLNEAANPKGATVTANVVFAGKNRQGPLRAALHRRQARRRDLAGRPERQVLTDPSVGSADVRLPTS